MAKDGIALQKLNVSQLSPAEQEYKRQLEERRNNVLRALEGIEFDMMLQVLSLAVRAVINYHVPRGQKAKAYDLFKAQTDRALNRPGA